MNQLINKKEFKTSNWSGGTTTELFIFPLEASFKKGDFSFRLSTASVEIEESIFTSLPEVKRTLMVLEGEIELMHLNHYSKLLKKYDLDTFDGGWNTHSKGKCIDFNLMTKGSCQGLLSKYDLKKGKSKILNREESGKIHFVYLIKGLLTIETGKESLLLSNGDLFVSDTPKGIKFLAKENSTFILVTIN